VRPKTIALSTLACPECGAPAKIEPDASTYTCRFCDTTLAVERPAPEPPPAAAPRPARTFDFKLPVTTPAAAPAKTGGNGWLGVVLLTVVLAAVGVGIAAVVSRGTIGGSSLFSWSGKEPLVCSGNERITVDHVTASFPKGTVIDASGNCHVVCKDCALSGSTVIAARENADVHLDHGTADGDVFDEVAHNARVTTDHTKVTGKRNEPSSSSGFEKPKWPASGPFVCGRTNGGGEFDGVKVKVTSGAAIIASVNCRLKLSHCTIEAPTALVLSDNADVELDDCEVHATNGAFARANGEIVIEGGSFVATDHAVTLAGNASLRAHGARVEGSKSTQGNAKVEVE
jgi:hypothetical protein